MNVVERNLNNAGYPVDCFIEKIDDNLVCGICHNIVRDPPNLEICPHLFCRICIERVTNNSCPVCRKHFKKPLASIPFVEQKINNEKIKCLYYEKGCEWVNTIGTDERNLISHLEKCQFGGFENCKLCSQSVLKMDLEEHKEVCLDEEVECRYCNVKMKRKLIPIHEFIGTTTGIMYCENSYMCKFKQCRVILKSKEELEYHLKNDCEKDTMVCCVCDDIHVVRCNKFEEHCLEQNATAVDVARSILKFRDIQRVKYGCIGSLIDVMIDDMEGGENREAHHEWVVAQIIDTISIPCKKVYCKIIGTDTRGWFKLEDTEIIGTFTSIEIVRENEKQVKKYILDWLKNFECSISVVPKNKYENQPFFVCRTCKTEVFSKSIIGCCLTCSIVCHQGHELVEIESEDRRGYYCRCGSGEMRSRNGVVVKCCANKRDMWEKEQGEQKEIESDDETEVIGYESDEEI